MRLIDADLMIKNLEKDYNSFMEQGHKKLANAILGVLIPIINWQPTVDTDKHGHWVMCKRLGDLKPLFDTFRCSACDNLILSSKSNDYIYCPYCGAKMDEVAE